MILKKTEAAKILGITPAAMTLRCQATPTPLYLKKIKGKERIDTDHPAWTTELIRKKIVPDPNENKNKKKVYKSANLQVAAQEAELNDTIYSSRIKEERAKQEAIRTAEIKKELAPISLVKYFFSFSENLIQRLYRRPHEISPQLSALFLAGEDKKAVDLLKRELEAIVKQTQKELVKAIEEEGYNAE